MAGHREVKKTAALKQTPRGDERRAALRRAFGRNRAAAGAKPPNPAPSCPSASRHRGRAAGTGCCEPGNLFLPRLRSPFPNALPTPLRRTPGPSCRPPTGPGAKPVAGVEAAPVSPEGLCPPGTDARGSGAGPTGGCEPWGVPLRICGRLEEPDGSPPGGGGGRHGAPGAPQRRRSRGLGQQLSAPGGSEPRG